MSLVLVTRFRMGILLAADSFIFDNNGEVPSKSMNFDKILISKKQMCAAVAVGSSWIFHEAHEWLMEQADNYDILTPLAAKWKELNVRWKADREKELTESDAKTLRPVSDSVLVMARQADLSRLEIIDPEGNLHTSETFVISGSGADIVRGYLKSEGKLFRSSDSYEECTRLLREVYQVASRDLYVTGFPSFAIVTKKKIINFSDACEKAWEESIASYWSSIDRSLNQAEPHKTLYKGF